MKKEALIFIGLVCSLNAYASSAPSSTKALLSGAKPAAIDVVDLYGDESAMSQQILKKYSTQVADLEKATTAAVLAFDSSKQSDKTMMQLALKKYYLTEKIKKEGNYAYVDFDVINYPDLIDHYTTIEVVKKNQPERLRFVAKDLTKKHYKSKNDLIQKMIDFEELEMRLALTKQIDLHQKCPVYHCVVGFSDSRLKPYLSIFNSGVIKQRQLILDTLNHDENPQRRIAAAFLMGHFSNPQEIISLLEPHVNDPDAGVRNGVIRVIGSTMNTAKITQINVAPFIKLLDSPYDTDRNKSLWVLSSAAKNKQMRSVIIQEGGEKLLALLRLKQPNNHDLAYLILKEVSGKDFGASNVAAWNKWFVSAQKATA